MVDLQIWGHIVFVISNTIAAFFLMLNHIDSVAYFDVLTCIQMMPVCGPTLHTNCRKDWMWVFWLASCGFPLIVCLLLEMCWVIDNNISFVKQLNHFDQLNTVSSPRRHSSVPPLTESPSKRRMVPKAFSYQHPIAHSSTLQQTQLHTTAQQ